MTPPAIVIALWSAIVDECTALRARWRADSARTWPQAGDAWHGWSVGYLTVIRLERRGDVAGVLCLHDQRHEWMPLGAWTRTTQRMTLVERGVQHGR